MANLTADVKTTELDVFEKIVGLYREITWRYKNWM